jgi:hypothetical protein
MFLTLDVRGMNDIKLIFTPIHAPSHELEVKDNNTPLNKIVRRVWLGYWALEKRVFIYGE